MIKPNDSYQIVNHMENPIQVLVNALLENDAALVQSVSYALLVSRRDVLTAEQHPLQGGLYITGVQSSGRRRLPVVSSDTPNASEPLARRLSCSRR